MTFIDWKRSRRAKARLPPACEVIKCSWCGLIIRLDGRELAPAMSQARYDRMLDEFLRRQIQDHPGEQASDR